MTLSYKESQGLESNSSREKTPEFQWEEISIPHPPKANSSKAESQKIKSVNSMTNTYQSVIDQIPVRYKGWVISTKVINGKLWLHWQHPKENFPRYGCPLNDAGVEFTINHLRFMIDLAIKLEIEAKNFGFSQR